MLAVPATKTALLQDLSLRLQVFRVAIGYRSPEFWPVVFVACSHPVRICAPLTAFVVQPVFQMLGSPVVPFYPFSFWVPLLKPNSRKKGTLIIKGLLGNLGCYRIRQSGHRP